MTHPSTATATVLAAVVAAPVPGQQFERMQRRFYRCCLGPALCVLAVIIVLPAAYLVLTSFSPLNLTRPQTAWDFTRPRFNYQLLLTHDRFHHSLWVQAKYSFWAAGLEICIGFLFALMLDIQSRFFRALRTIFMIPMVLPPIVVAIIWKIMYTPDISPLHWALATAGWNVPALITDPDRALPAIIIASTWQWFAFTIPYFLVYRYAGLLDTRIGLTLIYLTVNVSLVIWSMRTYIDATPRCLEEAAWIDGATLWQGLCWVVLPTAVPGLVATAILLNPFYRLPDMRKVEKAIEFKRILYEHGDRELYSFYWLMAGFTPEFLERRFDVVEKLASARAGKDRFIKSDVEQWMKWVRALRANWLTDEELARIATPTLVMGTELDSWHAGPMAEMARQVAARIPSSRLEILARAGAFIFIEDPDRFARTLLPFLGGIACAITAEGGR
ncbi:MAG: alpha/beta fold hydrolase [candidate division NC10 bacterium]|nr:alpha/beta fold hydrolase [candidate division NC10 bacterium]